MATEVNASGEKIQQITTAGGEVLIDRIPDAKEQSEIEALYKHVQLLTDATDKKSQQESYIAFLEAVKSPYAKVKVLTAQFIPRFFQHFQELVEQSIDALIDLIEQDDTQLSIHAINGLASLCSSDPKNVSKVADSLAQLLDSENVRELEAVKKALTSLAKNDIKALLAALFNQIQTGDERLRIEILQFIKEKLMTMADTLIKPYPDVEELIATLANKIVTNDEEFKILFDILSKLKKYTTTPNELLDVVAQRTGISTEGKEVNYEKALTAISNTTGLFARAGVGSNRKFFRFIINRVLSNFTQQTEQIRLHAIRVCAEIAPFTDSTDSRAALPVIYQLLISYMPPTTPEKPDFNFTYLEYLLYTFHQLAMRAPGALYPICGIKIVTGQPEDMISEDHSAKLTDFTDRLNFLETNAREYRVKIKNAGTTYSEKQAALAAKLIDNLIKMTASLKKKEPEFLGPKQVTLSVKATANTPTKRRAEEDGTGASTSGEGSSKKARIAGVYVPPHRKNPASTSNRKGGHRPNRGRGGGGRGRGRGGKRNQK